MQTSRSAQFTFTASLPGAAYQCSLDSGPWVGCASPYTLSSLTLGVHRFSVRGSAGTNATTFGQGTSARVFTVVSDTPGTVKPTEANTGVPEGTTLTPYYGDLVITQPGTVIDAMDIHGFVKIRAADVTITRSIIRGGQATGNIGLVTNVENGGPNFVITDSELVPEYPSVWIDGLKGWNITARRVEIHGTVDNVKLYGDNNTIESSLLHQTQYYDHDPNLGGSYTHNDGVQVLGGQHIRIIGNTIRDADNAGLQVTQDHSRVNDLVFSRNWADGGGCTVNLAHKDLTSMSGITINDNRFGRDTRVADCPILGSTATTFTADGNTYEDNGAPVNVRRNG